MNIRLRKSERHKETLRKLSHDGGNKCCFDCGVRGPLYVVSNFGILVCSGCSAVHRSFQHKVKGITMSEFTEDEIARFALAGNDRAHKVWLSTFSGQLPRTGDVAALKHHVRVIFEERQCWDAQEFTALQNSWEHPNESATPTPPPSTMTRPTAFTLAPPLEAPTAGSGSISAATTPAAPSSTVAPPSGGPSTLPVQTSQEDVFDSLFAPPVQSPPMPQCTTPAAVAGAPPITTSHTPALSAQQQQQQQATVSSIVDDLFAGVSQPVVTSAAGYGATLPPQQSMGCTTGGAMYNFTEHFPRSITAHPQLLPSHPPYQLPQEQQRPAPYAAGSQTGYSPCVGSHQMCVSDFSAQPSPAVNPCQQQGMPGGMFGNSSTPTPLSDPVKSPNYYFNSGAPSTTGCPSANTADPQAYQPSPFPITPPYQQQGWGAPLSFNAPPSQNSNRIVVLSVTKPPIAGPQNSQSLSL
ncbi:hypothetical protein JKF63_00319 [Porcisia hertigi]|uniref:Arf-GAP domain-containing protein n=1 Tax=Porcisia hertigi TaxID=2761500 RepID=A0A836HTE1_9TRYP|nr:hypothetical protein JKF63_00319 [Porcisia hertigi]